MVWRTLGNHGEQAELVDKAWSNVEAVYQASAELVPGIVSNLEVAGYVDQQTLASLTAFRDHAMVATLSAGNLADAEAVAVFEAA